MAAKQAMPAVAYVRMSSDKQEASPEQQRAEVAKLAKREGYRIIREYLDEGISGDATEKRKAFQRMIREAAEKRDFTAILCWDVSRFGRFDSIEAGHWIHPLRQAGVWLHTCVEGKKDWNTFAGRIVHSIETEGKHQYLEDLSSNVCRGRLSRMQAGTVCPGPIYGYDRVFYDQSGKAARRVAHGEKFSKPQGWTARLEPAEDEAIAGVVRWLYATFAAEDCGIHSLVAELNRRGVPSPRGRRGWSWSAVRYILTNPVYAGFRAAGKYTSGKFHQIGDNGEVTKGPGKRVHKVRKAPLFLQKGQHEPLVDPDTFELVQRKLEDRRTTRTRPRESSYLLSGIAFCGHCGGKLYGAPGGAKTEDGYSLRYYVCETGTKQGKSRCRKYAVRQDHLERYVLDVVYKAVSSPESVEQICQAIRQQAESKTAAKESTGGLEARISAMEAKIQRAAENALLADEETLPELLKVLGQWRKQRAALRAELEAKSRAGNPVSFERLAEKAIGELGRLREHLESGDRRKVRQVVKTVISRITCWWADHGKRRRLSRGLLEFNSRGIPRTAR